MVTLILLMSLCRHVLINLSTVLHLRVGNASHTKARQVTIVIEVQLTLHMERTININGGAMNEEQIFLYSTQTNAMATDDNEYARKRRVFMAMQTTMVTEVRLVMCMESNS